MKHTYLSTFLSGTNEVVLELLAKKVSDVRVVSQLDGLVIYQTNNDTRNLANIRFFNNTFLVIKEFDRLNTEYFKPMFRWVNTHSLAAIKNISPPRFKSFRIVLSDANQMVPYDKKTIASTENKISKETGLKINKVKPDTEIWFMHRSEGASFILLRLTNNSAVEHRKKGQLRPELANIMCLLSEPSKTDVFLDPFAGYGTIVEEGINLPFTKIISFEKEGTYFRSDKNIETHKADFFLNTIKDHTVSKIVTDPPWGIFEKDLDIKTFYTNMYTEFNRLLTHDGIIVLLLNRDTDILPYISVVKLKIIVKYDILVSGKKGRYLQA